MAQDSKYGRVTLERGDIAHDEPVVVFRAQDALLPAMLELYAQRCAEAGSPAEHLGRLHDTQRTIEAWQAEHFTKTPGERL
jgi:hypothetical protein